MARFLIGSKAEKNEVEIRRKFTGKVTTRKGDYWASNAPPAMVVDNLRAHHRDKTGSLTCFDRAKVSGIPITSG